MKMERKERGVQVFTTLVLLNLLKLRLFHAVIANSNNLCNGSLSREMQNKKLRPISQSALDFKVADFIEILS